MKIRSRFWWNWMARMVSDWEVSSMISSIFKILFLRKNVQKISKNQTIFLMYRITSLEIALSMNLLIRKYLI